MPSTVVDARVHAKNGGSSSASESGAGCTRDRSIQLDNSGRRKKLSFMQSRRMQAQSGLLDLSHRAVPNDLARPHASKPILQFWNEIAGPKLGAPTN